jgi:hypothetical protein
MTQKEIKNNLPQLPLHNKDGNVLDHNGKYILSVSAHGYRVETDNATESAIVHAINNTYDKGINPESVPEMLNTLIIVEQQLRLLSVHTIADNIQNIIKNATL